MREYIIFICTVKLRRGMMRAYTTESLSRAIAWVRNHKRAVMEVVIKGKL